MTDEPEPDVDQLLADLEKGQKAAHRVFRRTTVTSMGTLLLLAAFNATFLVLGQPNRWFWRDLVTILGLTAMGMLGYLAAARAYQLVVQRDAEVLDGLRKQAAMAKAIDDVRPLMAAVEDARARGVPVMVMVPADMPAPATNPTLN